MINFLIVLSFTHLSTGWCPTQLKSIARVKLDEIVYSYIWNYSNKYNISIRILNANRVEPQRDFQTQKVFFGVVFNLIVQC